MANTTNFNWETPDDTDLVKDGAAAIRTLGSAIDTSLVDLKGGTTGQVLSKATGTDMDFTWVTSDDANAIQNAIVDAKGDIIAASANDTPARLAVGTDNHRLVAASGETTGLKYVADTQNTVIDAEGDLLVGDAADTVQRLAIGTTGQVLTVDTAVDGKIKWATAAGGGSGLTLIDEIPVTSSGTINVDNVFTSTYKNYRILIVAKNVVSNANSEGTMKMRASSSDTSTGYNSRRTYAYSSTIASDMNAYGTDEWYVATFSADNAGNNGFSMDIYAPQLSSYTSFYGISFDSANNLLIANGILANTTAYDGFSLLFANAITGTIFVYGYAKE
jgi:hypothetical protein